MFLSICNFRKILTGVSACAIILSAPVDVQAQNLSIIGDFFADPVAVEFSDQDSFYDGQVLKDFYVSRDFKPFWHTPKGRIKKEARAFIQVLGESWSHGLNPARYHFAEIQELQASEDVDFNTLEMMLSDAFLRYIRDISGMRVSAQGMALREGDWLQPYPVNEVMRFMVGVNDFENLPWEVVPKSGTYRRLHDELINLVHAYQKSDDVDLPRVVFDRIIRPGVRHRHMPNLRARLGVEPMGADERLYDDRLAGAVMTFQREHGLKVDGVLGPQTVHVINQGLKDKIYQIIVNLERLRWKPEPKTNRFVVVNVPSAMLWVLEDSKLAFEMPVIVGKVKRQTNIFISEIIGVRVNPDWTVPPTVKRKDIIPAVMEDPDYFTNKGMRLYSGYGADAEQIDPESIAWDEVNGSDLLQYRMVQPPSAYNPLGRYRVLMPNEYNIYLHDTNEKQHFKTEMRALSSGCVRMSEPRKMAEFILKGSKNEEKLSRVLKSGRKTDLTISDRIPVYIFYYTIWVDDEGRLIYGNDLYLRDALLLEKLAAIDGFMIPGHNSSLN